MRDRGFAVLIVLWSLALLALLGSTITAAGRSETRIAANLLASANAEAAADGAVAVAAFHLLDSSDQHWDPGKLHLLTIGECSVQIALDDQRGKIDPNDAPPGLVAALLRRLGVDSGTAGSLANAVTDWRTVNDSGLVPAYLSHGAAYGPPHEPFQTLDEVSMVLGMTPQLMELVRPHMSLFIEQTPNPNQADALVAGAIADAVKRGQLSINADEQAGPLIVLVTVTARNRGATFVRTALLRMNGVNNQPYEVLDWN